MYARFYLLILMYILCVIVKYFGPIQLGKAPWICYVLLFLLQLNPEAWSLELLCVFIHNRPRLSSMLLYVHRDHTDCLDGEPRTATSTFTQLLTSGQSFFLNCCFTSTETIQTIRDGLDRPPDPCYLYPGMSNRVAREPVWPSGKAVGW